MDAARAMVSSMSRAVWRRPMAWSTVSSRDWGLTLMRSAPWSSSTWSLSRVMVSGRPASMQYSTQPDRAKLRFRWVSSRSICWADRVVGVPPPI